MFTVNKLKISGFKSFAHQTELLIEHGVTGIIGPNGCGKSNIFEAIRWVMGESSSKSLRSGAMDDVIFNGTQNIPAKNFAEVSIELDNFEGEVPGNLINEKKLIISRTIERGVGSFYKINNKDVRAKDISTLFYDSGSGPRSSSIISQGNIDQVINSKPIDRKIILEDAAGTSGLQARRHESELKLLATEDNLEKIDINLNNLKDQKRDLSRQARQAEKYEQISDNIKFYQSILVFTQWKKNSNQISEAEIIKKNMSEETKNIINHLSSVQKNLESEKEKIMHLNSQKDELNKKKIQVSSEISKYKNQLQEINNKKVEIERFLITIKNDKELEKKRYLELQTYIENLKQKLLKPTDLNEKKKKLIELVREEAELKNKLKQLETIYVNEMQLSLGEEFKSDNLKENRELLQKKKNHIEESISKLNHNLKNQEREFITQKKENEILKINIDKTNKFIVDKKKIIDNTKINNNKLTDDIKKISVELDICSTQSTKIETELDTLNSLSNNAGLSNESIVNLVKIKKGYENAVYAALTNELDATLKRSPKRWIRVSLEQVQGIDNNLSQFVDGPKELDLILSQIGFLENTDLALDMQKKLKVGQSLVDKNGCIWRWDGFISEDNLQKKKIIDAQLKIKKLIIEQEQYKKKLTLLKTKKDNFIHTQSKFLKILNTENSELEKIYRDYDTNYSKLSNLKEKLSITKFNIEDSNNKLKELNNEYKSIGEEINKIKVIEINADKNEKNEKEEVQKNIEFLDRQLEDKRDEIASLKESTMKEELNETYLKNDLQKTQNRTIESDKQIQILEEREIDYLQNRKKLDDLPSAIKNKIDHFQGLWNDIEKRININNTSNNEINKIVQTLDKQILNLNRGREEKINEITRIDSNLDNLKVKDKELRTIIYQRSKVQPEELEKDLDSKKTKMHDYEDLKLKLDKLINQREQMGPVNLRAKIEENQINISIEELETEKLDLFQAIEKLRLAINKINKEGKNRLLKAYEEVNKNFSDLFVKLFNGGEAKLDLIKSDDPLQTGIEIYARPPGKKLSSISLLSGGEKALTAISLIFSIFLINPSPICILDEVDAALDEPNVEKFCNILLELKKETKTKFLIITHHKITMTSIDRVYGVTMAQKGISDIVSVDFQKIDLQKAV